MRERGKIRKEELERLWYQEWLAGRREREASAAAAVQSPRLVTCWPARCTLRPFPKWVYPDTLTRVISTLHADCQIAAMSLGYSICIVTMIEKPCNKKPFFEFVALCVLWVTGVQWVTEEPMKGPSTGLTLTSCGLSFCL